MCSEVWRLGWRRVAGLGLGWRFLCEKRKKKKFLGRFLSVDFHKGVVQDMRSKIFPILPGVIFVRL